MPSSAPRPWQRFTTGYPANRPSSYFTSDHAVGSGLATSRFLVVGLNEPKTLCRGYFAIIFPPKSDDAFARDHFEPSLLVRRPNVTAIDAHRDRTIGRWGRSKKPPPLNDLEGKGGLARE